MHWIRRFALCAVPARLLVYVSAVLAALLTLHTSAAQESAQRLILKDGSYQLVSKYQIKGDRVRYFSAEREEWEELPYSLVDWPATEKSEKERAAAASSPEAVQLDKEAEREAEEAPLPEVASGLRLPEDSGVFLLDSYQGQPQIVEMQQTTGDVNRDTKKNIFRGAINPITGLKQSIELQGGHAALQSHVAVPSIYISADTMSDETDSSPRVTAQSPLPQQPEKPQQALVPFNRFRIVRAQVLKGKRIIGDVRRSVTGKVSQEQHFVKTTIDRVAGDWLKVTPTEPLADGEYCLVEIVGQEGMNLMVWDFGVNPKAPANHNPWKPAAKTAPAAKQNNH